MAASPSEAAVRNYLAALKDPSSLQDSEKIAELESALESSGDELERLRLRQEIIDAQSPPVERYEDEFVTHAKEWADRVGITDRAFLEEGVPPQVLRRAGFRVSGGGRGGRRGPGRTRSRVTTEEVRAAIPRGTFTIKRLQDLSGASPAVVRKVVQEEEAAGRLERAGKDPQHVGPGRSPILYNRK
jgi:hypothetical protein